MTLRQIEVASVHKDAQWAYLTLRDVPYATDFTEPQR